MNRGTQWRRRARAVAAALTLALAPAAGWSRPSLAPLPAPRRPSLTNPATGSPSGQGAVPAPTAPLLVAPAGSGASQTRSSAPRGAAPRSAEPEATGADFDTISVPNELFPATREPPLATLEEWIVGFRLALPDARRPILTIEDLDVLVTPAGERLLPVFRLMRALQEKVEVVEEDADGPLRFTYFPSRGRRVGVSVLDESVQIGFESRSVPVVRRWSEFTRRPEVYLPESVVAESLGYETHWDEANFEIRAVTDELPSWYAKELSTRRLTLQGIEEVPPNLPEVLPPARPSEWGLQFAEIALSGRYSASRDLKEDSYRQDRFRERFWARGFGGTARLDLSQTGIDVDSQGTRFPGTRFMVDRAWWERRGERGVLTLGDVELGLGELVFPGVQPTGVRWAGGSSASSRRRFVPEITVEDMAPLDSQVDLYVNDQFVESLRVRDPLKEAPGFGFFRFEGVALIPGRDNEVRLLITEPSGFRRELVRTVWGSRGALAPGTFGALVGVGTYRSKSEWESDGVFGGGLLQYGVAPGLAAEVIAGYQNEFSASRGFGGGAGAEDGAAPLESLHLGVGLLWEPYKGGRLKADVAGSWGLDDDSEDWGARLRGSLPVGPVEFRPDVFRMGPEFYDGQSTAGQDRSGFWLEARTDERKRLTLRGGVGRVRDNLDGTRPRTLKETFEHLEAGMHGVIPRTDLTLAGDFVQQRWDDGRNLALYSAVLTSRPVSRIHLEGRAYWGDEIRTVEHDELVNGVRVTGLPFYLSPFKGGRITWLASRNAQFSLAHWDYRTREESQAGLSVQGSYPLRWAFGSELANDWDDGDAPLSESLVWRGRLNVFLNDRGNRRLTVQASYRRSEWSLVGGFNFLEVFGFSGKEPVWLTGRGVSPDRGLVMGRVFLDRNGDGRRQEEEPGVGGVRVSAGRYFAETDASGRFVFDRWPGGESGRVALDHLALDALYTPTNGTQRVELSPGGVSTVELGLAVLGAVHGVVEQVEPDGTSRGRPGVVVALYDAEGVKVAESVTASDGTYYIGEVRPGVYWVRIQEASLPEDLAPGAPPRKVVMVSGVDEPIDQQVDLLVTPKQG
ncbi:MAG: hypothetical protein Kow0092_21670 [Deferrisomatales bacterium]